MDQEAEGNLTGAPKITLNKIISIKNGKVIPKILKRKAVGRKNGVWVYNVKA